MPTLGPKGLLYPYMDPLGKRFLFADELSESSFRGVSPVVRFRV